MSIEVTQLVNGFIVEGPGTGPIVVEGTNPRTVAAKLGRTVIKALAEKTAGGEVAPNVE